MEVPRTPGGTELADNVNLLGDNLRTLKKSTEVGLVASTEFVLEVNAEKTKYMFMFSEQDAGKRNIHLKYFGTHK
jgi:hypothetical protein